MLSNTVNDLQRIPIVYFQLTLAFECESVNRLNNEKVRYKMF